MENNRINNNWIWLSSLRLPYLFGLMLSFVSFIAYFSTIYFLFSKSADQALFLNMFIYAFFAIPYAIYAYFQNGVFIARSFIFDWHYFFLNSLIKRPYLFVVIIPMIIFVNNQYKEPIAEFESLNALQEVVERLNNDVNEFQISQNSLEESLGAKLRMFESFEEEYKIFYSFEPPANPTSREVDAIWRDYNSFRNFMKRQPTILDQRIREIERAEARQISLANRVDAISNNLDSACSEPSEEIASQSSLEALEESCEDMREKLQQAEENLVEISFERIDEYSSKIEDGIQEYESISDLLSDWNNWVAAQRNVNESIDFDNRFRSWFPNSQASLEMMRTEFTRVGEDLTKLKQKEEELDNKLQKTTGDLQIM